MTKRSDRRGGLRGAKKPQVAGACVRKHQPVLQLQAIQIHLHWLHKGAFAFATTSSLFCSAASSSASSGRNTISLVEHEVVRPRCSSLISASFATFQSCTTCRWLALKGTFFTSLWNEDRLYVQEVPQLQHSGRDFPCCVVSQARHHSVHWQNPCTCMLNLDDSEPYGMHGAMVMSVSNMSALCL
jgi:hypothetical protein